MEGTIKGSESAICWHRESGRINHWVWDLSSMDLARWDGWGGKQLFFTSRYHYNLCFGESQTKVSCIVLKFTFYKGYWTTASNRNSEVSHQKTKNQKLNKTRSSEGYKELNLFSLSENECQIDYRNKAIGTWWHNSSLLVDRAKCLQYTESKAKY